MKRYFAIPFLLILMSACSGGDEGSDSGNDSSGDGDGNMSGDGDGAPSGDGDGAGAPSGDGDGNPTGDGDFSGDGDFPGDGDFFGDGDFGGDGDFPGDGDGDFSGDGDGCDPFFDECGGGSGGGGSSDLKRIGETCNWDDECESDDCTGGGLRDGYCTIGCTSDFDCPSAIDYTCDSHEGNLKCLKN